MLRKMLFFNESYVIKRENYLKVYLSVQSPESSVQSPV